jgi:hypothetical protein
MLAWLAIGVFVLMSVLNDLDRQLIAAAAPLLKEESILPIGGVALLAAVTCPSGMSLKPLAQV